MSGVVVTGAASGIGRACAEVLIAEGRSVSLWDYSPTVLDVGEVLGMSAFVVDDAHAATFFISPKAAFITGTHLVVDGGTVAANH
jgi:NAD(P)-dependent dehydrogenase (short-subunit alcohol dehydrogenase family)